MMYSHKMAFAIKSNGQVLREYGDKVYVKFGSEYSILIKNLHTTRALVNVFIDGVNQTPGGLVVDAGRECNFERSLLNGSLTTGNKFKFIERTGAVEEHRGVKLEDGLVRIDYQFESQAQIRSHITWSTPTLVQDHYYNGLKVGTSSSPLTVNPAWLTASGSSGISGSTGLYSAQGGIGSVQGAAGPGVTGLGSSATSGVYNVGGTLRSVDVSNGQFTGAVAQAAVNQYCADNGIKNVASGEVHDGCATMDLGFNDAGITVSGSKSNQSFATTVMGNMDPQKFSMVIKLLGETPDNRPVLKPVTVKAKPKCVTCGRQNKATAKFCAECGTALEIFA